MSERLYYKRANCLSKLHDELLAVGIKPLLVEGLGDDIWITIDDVANTASVDAIVAAHDPTPLPVVDPDAELEAAILAVTTLEELKDALTGRTIAVAAKGRIK